MSHDAFGPTPKLTLSNTLLRGQSAAPGVGTVRAITVGLPVAVAQGPSGHTGAAGDVGFGALHSSPNTLTSDQTVSTANTDQDVLTSAGLIRGLWLASCRLIVTVPAACQVTAKLRDAAGQVASTQRTAHASTDVVTLVLFGYSDQTALADNATGVLTLSVAATVSGVVVRVAPQHNAVSPAAGNIGSLLTCVQFG